jgi:hypothetical protein
MLKDVKKLDKMTAIETVQYPFNKEEIEFVMSGLK